MDLRLLLLLFCSSMFTIGQAEIPATSTASTLLLDIDASLYTLTISNTKLAGSTCLVEGLIENLGAEPLTEFKVSWTDGDQVFEDHVTGLQIPSQESYHFTHTVPYQVKFGFQELTVSITDVNGQIDDDPSNNIQILDIEGVTPAADKVVLAEMGTGTWCSWCPRGIVNMERMYAQYADYFVGVEIHKDDPMENLEYREAFAAPTWPIARIDRYSGFVDPAEMEAYFMERIQQTPLAVLTNGAAYDPISRELQLSVSANFAVPLAGDYRLGLILLEDQVTGEEISYGQANNYAGGAAGPMGGFEDLPLFIFPENMVYNNVGRAVFGGMDGVPGSLPGQMAIGQTYTYGFSYLLPEDVAFENLRLISVLVTPQGLVDNARPNTLQEALDQGYNSPNVSTTAAIDVESLQVFPNPFQDHLQIQLELEQGQTLRLRLLNSLGQILRDSGPLESRSHVQQQWATADLDAGFYFLQVQIGDQQLSRKLVLNK